MAAATGLRCWYSSRIARSQSFVIWLGRGLSDTARHFISLTGSFIHEWTPFLLIMSYFVFSICLYIFCTEKLIDMFWFLYLTTNFYIATSTVLEALMSIAPCREARMAVRKSQDNDWVFPTPDHELLFLDLLIVAYLPNEEEIIMDRVRYALDEIKYPSDRIRINLVYNTPVPIEPLETKLSNLALRKPHFRSVKVPGSTSKADNLNYFFSLRAGSDITVIFDADHYPHPYGPRWAAERFLQDQNTDVVQGRCVIFNSTTSWLSAMISVEFDKIYAVSHPGRAALWGFGIFTGSNGYWRTPLLHKIEMDGTLLTEDIDSAMRALSRGATIVHDLNVISYELAPTSLPALWKQRLRWAQGWTQVSLRHCPLTFTRPTEGTRCLKTRLGLLFLLLVRESSYYLVTQYLCLVLSFVFTDFPRSRRALANFVFFQFDISEWFFFISVVCLITTLVITNRVKSEFASRWMIVMFSIIYSPYLIVMATMGLYGHARQVTRYSRWNATKRT